MVVLVFGTTGELIKILPLIKSLPENEYLTICTYQQPQQLKELFGTAGLRQPDFKIGRSENATDLEKKSSIPPWMIKTLIGFIKNRRQIISKAGKNKKNVIFLVHGDTLTTVLGAFMGRMLGFKVGHIEAGLRSYNWRHPFPEEIDRIIASKIARIHFSPGKIPVKNLIKAGTKGEIIDTRLNTVLDSLRLAKQMAPKLDFKLPKRFAVVSIHRNELLARPDELKELLEQLAVFADKIPLVFLDHPVTKERLSNLNYNSLIEHKNITRVPKLSYLKFIQVLVRTECVITDSGGLQEESAYLGIPCLIHRMATERQEGLGSNVVLSNYDKKIVEEFMSNYSKYRSEPVSQNIKPTNVIINKIRQDGYLA